MPSPSVVKIRAQSAAIGFGPVFVAGLLLMLCHRQQQAWTLLIGSATFYFLWITRGNQ